MSDFFCLLVLVFVGVFCLFGFGLFAWVSGFFGCCFFGVCFFGFFVFWLGLFFFPAGISGSLRYSGVFDISKDRSLRNIPVSHLCCIFQ